MYLVLHVVLMLLTYVGQAHSFTLVAEMLWIRPKLLLSHLSSEPRRTSTKSTEGTSATMSLLGDARSFKTTVACSALFVPLWVGKLPIGRRE